MAQRTQVILEDDIDGSAADETVSFAVDGVTYEIDLNAANASTLRETVAPWVQHARRVGGRRSRCRNTRPGGANDIRAWAIAHGITVSTRGRISQDIKDAYEAAH